MEQCLCHSSEDLVYGYFKTKESYLTLQKGDVYLTNEMNRVSSASLCSVGIAYKNNVFFSRN